MRDVCVNWMENLDIQLGGFDEDGSPIIVEIDETVYCKRKYNRGWMQRSQWVFGAIERGTHHCYLEAVSNRRQEVLLPLIEKWILPGSHIMSDGWNAYQNIDTLSGGKYMHDVIIHCENFVAPNNDVVHTQSIESTWGRLKKIKGRTTPQLIHGYLAEFMCREWHREVDFFVAILLEITINYPC
jgi:IS1 family transposase